MALCLQACVSGGKELPVLLAREPAHSSEQKPKRLEASSDEKIRQLPPLASMQDAPPLSVQAATPNSRATGAPTADLAQTPSSYVSAPVYPYQDHFKRLQKIIDRDIGHCLGTDTVVIPQLVKAGLRSDYQGQLAALRHTLDKAAVLKEMAALAQAAHFLAPKVYALLLEASKDAEWSVRCAASTGLGVLARTVPMQAPLASLFKAAEQHHHVRHAATYVLGELVGVDADAFTPVYELLIKLAENVDSHHSMRCAAIHALGGLTKAHRRQAAVIYEVLLIAAEDQDHNVRHAAIHALGELVKATPSRAASALIRFLKAAKDDHKSVRTSATFTLGAVAEEVGTSQAAHILEALLKAAEDSHADVRKAATYSLGKLVRVLPRQAAPILKALCKVAAWDRSCNTRRSAIHALGALVQVVPDKAVDVLKLFLRTASDTDYAVRCATIQMLKQLVSATPTTTAILTRLLKAVGDRHENVRIAAACALEEFAAVVPSQVAFDGAYLEVLLKATGSSDWLVCKVATQALKALAQKMPSAEHCATLLKAAGSYWSTAGRRYAAAQALTALAKAAPSVEKRGMLLKALSYRSTTHHRIAAISALLELVKAAPQLANDHLCAALLKATKDYRRADVRCIATHALELVEQVRRERILPEKKGS